MFFAKSIGTKTYAVACALTICVMALAAVPATAQENAPLTLPFLQCMPKQTAVALGLPPLNNLVATLLPIVDRIAPELGAKDVLDGAILDASIELGLDADNLAELGKELGLDLDAPIVAFVDVAPTVKSIEEIQAKVAAEREAYEAAKAAEAAESAEESAEPTPMSDFDEAKAFQKALDKMLTIPAFTVVLGVSDAEKAETTLKDLGVMYADLDPDAFENVSAGDVTMKSLGADNFNYFIAENKLALSNSVDLAANTALRLKEPATLRYGTAECPAIAPNEISLLFYGADFLPALMAVAGAFQNEDPTTKALIEKQVGNMAALWEGDAAHDPLLVTLGVRDNRLELTSRLDTAVHPAALTQSGEAKPLRYAPMLSENTLLFLSLFLTPEIKTMLSEMVIDTIVAQSGGDARMAQGVTMGKQVLQMIGPEVTLGLAAADDFPSATLMIGLENPEATKGLLQMFVPTMPEETHNEVEINSIVAGIPVPLSIAYLGDMVLVSNSIDEMKRIIDLSKAEKHSDLFASLKPALDPATPRYNALLLKTSLYTDVVEPLANLFGALPADAGMIAGQVAAAVDEVRIVSEMNGSWQKSGLSIALK